MKKTYATIGVLENSNVNFKSMIVTLDELRENRSEIIKHILTLTTQDQVMNVMTKMVNRLGEATCYIKLANEVIADLGLLAIHAQLLAEDTLKRNKQTMSIR